MTTNVLDVEIARLERQLADLKAQREQAENAEATGNAPATRSHLFGIIAGQSETTWEDFQEAKYKPKLNWLDDEAETSPQ